MKTVGLFEAKTKLSEICERVFTSQEPIVITRRGKPLVEIKPCQIEKKEKNVWELRREIEAQEGPFTEEFELLPREPWTDRDYFPEIEARS